MTGSEGPDYFLVQWFLAKRIERPCIEDCCKIWVAFLDGPLQRLQRILFLALESVGSGEIEKSARSVRVNLCGYFKLTGRLNVSVLSLQEIDPLLDPLYVQPFKDSPRDPSLANVNGSFC